MRAGSLCTGAGGFELGLEMVMDADLAFVADNSPGASMVLMHRFPEIPNLGDLARIDWGAIEPVDVLTMGFPCQNVSQAGDRDGLKANNRSGVWYQCARAIDALRPPLVLIENVRGLLSARADSDVEFCPWCMGTRRDKHPLRALAAVLASLADIGYDADWQVVSASDVGAPHRRDRVFIVAWPAAEDPDCPAGGEWWQSASGQAACWRPRADTGRRGGVPAISDARREHGLRGASQQDDGHEDEAVWSQEVHQADGHREASLAADTRSAGLEGIQGVPGQEPERSPEGSGGHGPGRSDWGPYAAAVARWEGALGRRAPSPTEPGRTGERLSPLFVEWIMGLPEGWITAVPELSRRQQMMALGNGCVPLQAALALQLLLPVREVCASLRLELRGSARHY